MKNLVWLASFPKSGNTWMRLLLEAYAEGIGHELDFNRVDISRHSAGRELFDRVIGLESSDLIPAEIDRYRPYVFHRLAADYHRKQIQENGESYFPLYIKVHDRFYLNDQQAPLFPPETTRLAVYIIRNPLSIAPSYANHRSCSIEEAIESMADETFSLSAQTDRLVRQLPQWVGSWHSHVSSWLEQTLLPVHVVRYEDLSADPHAVFTAVLRAAGVEPEPERVAWAVEQARFDRLRRQEAEAGFRERPSVAERFFRRGETAGWRDELTPDQIQRIIDCHGDVMARFHYIPQHKEIRHVATC